MSTTFIDVDGAVKYVSQFTGNSHKAATDMVPAVYFKLIKKKKKIEFAEYSIIFLDMT